MEEWFYCNGYYASDNLKKMSFMVLTQFLEMKNKLEIPRTAVECIFKLEDMLAKYGLTAYLLEASPFYLYALFVYVTDTETESLWPVYCCQ